MLVVGISGSPKRGNSEYLLDEALKVASGRGFQTKRLLCSELNVGYCTDCGACGKGEHCPNEDDMDRVNAALAEAAAVVVASPVYFGTVTAQLKAIFDRTLPLRRQGMQLQDKVGAAIAVGGSRNGGQEKTIEAIHSWMHIQGMIVVGDNSHFGGIAVRPAKEDRLGLETVAASANKVCDLLDKIGRGGAQR
ncbi:MAG: flavodoxin family protein [Methanotrichaceae archaeon]|nr:flavodoxin family protein [Methanotrichaceae archaeon]